MIFWKRDCVVCTEFVTNILYDATTTTTTMTVYDAMHDEQKISDNGNNIQNMGRTIAISVHYFTINSGENFDGKKQNFNKSSNEGKKQESELKSNRVTLCAPMVFVLT